MAYQFIHMNLAFSTPGHSYVSTSKGNIQYDTYGQSFQRTVILFYNTDANKVHQFSMHFPLPAMYHAHFDTQAPVFDFIVVLAWFYILLNYSTTSYHIM